MTWENDLSLIGDQQFCPYCQGGWKRALRYYIIWFLSSGRGLFTVMVGFYPGLFRVILAIKLCVYWYYCLLRMFFGLQAQTSDSVQESLLQVSVVGCSYVAAGASRPTIYSLLHCIHSQWPDDLHRVLLTDLTDNRSPDLITQEFCRSAGNSRLLYGSFKFQEMLEISRKTGISARSTAWWTNWNDKQVRAIQNPDFASLEREQNHSSLDKI